mgnify:CR=1 FL=1
MEQTTIHPASTQALEAFEAEAEVVRLLEQLTEFGLVPAGTFEVEPPAGPPIVARPLVDPAGAYYATVIWSPIENVYVQVTTRFDDGSALTTTSPVSADLAEVNESIDPLNLITLHHGDASAELTESGCTALSVNVDNIAEGFADDESRLIDSAFQAGPEMAAAGYLQSALSEESDEEVEPATRLTAYTEEDIVSVEFAARVIDWLAGHGLVAEEVSGYEMDELDDAAWAEILADGEVTIDGAGPVPWQAVIDMTTLAEVDPEIEAELSPFEVSLAIDDPEAAWITPDLLRQLTRELAELTGAIITYCEAFDFGINLYCDGLEAGAWLQIHSPRCIEHFGADRYGADAPATITDLGALGKLVQLADEPASTEDLDDEGQAWAKHLGDVELPAWKVETRLVEGDVYVEPESEPWAADDDNELDVEPLADRRGVEGFSQTYHALFVLADPPQVAEALATVRGSLARGPVDGTAQSVTADNLMVYRIGGHAWTGVVDCASTQRPLGVTEAKAVSAALDTRAILHFVDPAVEAIAFELWESGELVEQLSFGLHDAAPGPFAGPQSPELAGQHVPAAGLPGLWFASALRDVDIDSITDPYAFVDHCFRVQDCYDPSWTFEELLSLVTGDPIDPADVPIDPADVEMLYIVE